MKRVSSPPKSLSVPLGIALDRRLKPISVRLVAALLHGARGADSCLTSDKELAAFCGAGVRTVERGLAELRDAGYIRREGLPWTFAYPVMGRWVHLLWLRNPDLIPAPPEPLDDAG